jgi:outer membrane protein assembly factor BamB
MSGRIYKVIFFRWGLNEEAKMAKRQKFQIFLPFLAFLPFLLLPGLPVSTFAQDWPQWGGPGRDFKTTVTGLRNSWPASGPPQLWNRSLGEGHSAIVAEGGRLYTMYRKGEQEVVIALDAKTGKTIWEYCYASPYLRGMDMSYGDGPHTTPLIAGQSLYTAGATGKLFCLEKATGKPRWSHGLWQGFTGGTHMGYSSSPLAYKNTLIMQADGAGRSLMAFGLNSGRVVWQALNFRISNSSPIIINVDGQDQLVVFTHGEILGADPNDGALLWLRRIAAQWEFHFTISTPVWGPGNLLFASAAYGIGGRALHLSRSDGRTIVKELWQSERARVHKENAIRLGDVIYASTGHLGPAFFTAIDVKTGEVLWQDRSFSHSTFLYADGKFIILDEDGTLGLATPTASGLTVHSRVQIATSRTWTVPTIVGRTLYLRDRKTIMALQL